MKYSKEMLVAHKQSIEAYESLLAFAKDTSNTLEAVKRQIRKFYASPCNYCRVDDTLNGSSCSGCVLSTDYMGDCNSGDSGAGYMLRDPGWISGDSREEIIDLIILRHGTLALQAEFNITEK